MSKIKTAFFCTNCGYESPKWVGKCPSCNSWNSFTEEIVSKNKNTTAAIASWEDYHSTSNNKSKLIALKNIEAVEHPRVITPDTELNRVLGGGIVPGSLVLVAGEPGIGKSTLFLQTALQLKGVKVLYISGEESEQQIKLRADRLEMKNEEIYLLTETSVEAIFSEIKKLKPQ